LDSMSREEHNNANRIREQVKNLDLRYALRTLYDPVEHDDRFSLLLRRLEEKEQETTSRHQD